MKLMEVCKSIQNYGLQSGAISTIVRFGGCSLKPKDEPVPLTEVPADVLDVGPPFVLDKILDLDPYPRHIFISGGEPVEQPEHELFSLLQSLSGWCGVRGLESVTVETHGHRDLRSLCDKPFRKIVNFCVNLRTLSSGCCGKMLKHNYKLLISRDTVVCRCRTDNDYDWAVSFLTKVAQEISCRPTVVFASPDGEGKMWIANRLTKENDFLRRYDVRVGLDVRRSFLAR